MLKRLMREFRFRGRSSVLPSPMAGRVISLSQVQDQTFAAGLLGEGVAIEPTGCEVVAPSDGKVKAIFPTGYAVALRTCEGFDVLIHVGISTSGLNGRHFRVHASVGDSVKQGDLLIEFDRDAIVSEGYDMTVPILICNSAEFSRIRCKIGQTVEELDTLMSARER
ncbi:PTS system IIA component, Glc family [Coriobacterium glomerans PW2]|uniref:PTS system IIA component, Glc family n=1 Tax=Coriobacterium glomerans (strain ATCC 49209 / DSM 20642 / JCM 10262 / PW2) TaxID=700015 RepID=F2NAR9_CORGP|nr:PTS glucose transporter subunit IIA [Coriobacterium glomerans]AEB07525.1 PTS system IIA component, Glc family [Coriobacterium glomerans PW2]